MKVLQSNNTKDRQENQVQFLFKVLTELASQIVIHPKRYEEFVKMRFTV